MVGASPRATARAKGVQIMQSRFQPTESGFILEAEVLDRFGRCLAGFNLEGAAELAW